MCLVNVTSATSLPNKVDPLFAYFSSHVYAIFFFGFELIQISECTEQKSSVFFGLSVSFSVMQRRKDP